MRYTKKLTSDVVIVGAGAAGLMAAVTAARRGLTVTVLDPNSVLGKKLRITGKGRCNLTNNCLPQEFLQAVLTNQKFLRSALYQMPPSETMSFFENLGVALKTERGARVFPVSDNANDVADALVRAARDAGARFIQERVLSILAENGAVVGVKTQRRTYSCRAVILSTGGLSYPGTGSTGDGYLLARALGHTITRPTASLVPLVGEQFCSELQGLSLRNVELSLFEGDNLLFCELGELLFTHFGVSGPLVLSASAYMRSEGEKYRLSLDLKPGLSLEKLDARLLRDFSDNRNRDFRNSLDGLLPQKLIPVMVRLSGISGETKVNAVTRAERLCLGRIIKDFRISITGKRPLKEAIVTAGGVDVREIHPRTMASQIVAGLYFAGEVMDVDACTGGYNLQIAWSTAYSAATSVLLEE